MLDSLKSAIDTQSINYEYVPSADIQNQSEEALILEALTRLETKERRIKEAYENEVDTLEEYKDNKCRLQAERKSLLTSLERLHQEQPDFPIKLLISKNFWPKSPPFMISFWIQT